MNYLIEYILLTISYGLAINFGLLVRAFVMKWKKDETLLFLGIVNILFIIFRIYHYSKWLQNEELWDTIYKNFNK